MIASHKIGLLTCLFAILFQVQLLGDTYAPRSLLIEAYSDGIVDVIYEVDTDPSLHQVEVLLLGTSYSRMLVTGDGGALLGHSMGDGLVVVDSLGSSKVKVTYSTPDLTNKAGSIWTVVASSPISFTVSLPTDSTVMGLSASPSSITAIDARQVLTLPAGSQEVSYQLGVVGNREQVLVLLGQVQENIRDAQNGVDLTEAEEKLNEANQEFEAERYSLAETLARDAQRLIDDAVADSGETQPSDTILTSLLTQPLLIPGIIGGIALATVLAVRRRKPKAAPVAKTFRKVDVAKILEVRPDLRLEDREALEFLAEAGGEAFESELRDRFKLPRSTVWRMIKRLEREGLVEVRKMGGLNVVRILEKTSHS